MADFSYFNYSCNDIIKYPIITDKATRLLENNQYSFVVSPTSSKPTIKAAIEYLFDDTKFIRRVYFTADPYDYDDHIDSVIFDNIDDVEISFLSDNRWFTEWPAGQTAAYKIPKLVKIEINDKDRDFEIIINPNIDYVYR